MTVATVDYHINGNEFLINCKSFDVGRVKAITGIGWDPGTSTWVAPANKQTALEIGSTYSIREINEAARKEIKFLTKTQESGLPRDFKFKNQPRPYQWDALDKMYGKNEFALLMEMRTGKSFVDINIAACYFKEGKINAYLIVMFPGAIKTTWKIQLEEHMPVPYDLHILTSGKNAEAHRFINKECTSDTLKVMVVGIESLSAGSGPQIITDFVNNHKLKFTIDESTCIKNPRALTRKKPKKRTRVKLCWDLGGLAEYRTIMTGTPITQGIQDFYSQYRFLNWSILGYKSYYTFQNAHCVMGGFQGKKITGYRSIDTVIERIIPHTYQISTEDAIGIPEEIYERVLVEPSAEQNRMLKELGDPYDMSTQLDGQVLKVETILERMVRYQQIVGGHFPFKDEGKISQIRELKANPKMEALKGMIEAIPKDHRIIIWARFVPEIFAIGGMLESIGESYITYRGGMTDDERERAQRMMMEEDGPRFWVATQQASGRGIELAVASVHLYYSNSFSYDDRKQSEMRTNSSKQKSKSILYVDIIMNHKIDNQIADSLRRKMGMADYVTETIKRVT